MVEVMSPGRKKRFVDRVRSVELWLKQEDEAQPPSQDTTCNDGKELCQSLDNFPSNTPSCLDQFSQKSWTANLPPSTPSCLDQCSQRSWTAVDVGVVASARDRTTVDVSPPIVSATNPTPPKPSSTAVIRPKGTRASGLRRRSRTQLVSVSETTASNSLPTLPNSPFVVAERANIVPNVLVDRSNVTQDNKKVAVAATASLFKTPAICQSCSSVRQRIAAVETTIEQLQSSGLEPYRLKVSKLSRDRLKKQQSQSCTCGPGVT